MKQVPIDKLKTIKQLNFDDEIIGVYSKAQYCNDSPTEIRPNYKDVPTQYYKPNFQIAIKRNGIWNWDGYFIVGLKEVKSFINEYDFKKLKEQYETNKT